MRNTSVRWMLGFVAGAALAVGACTVHHHHYYKGSKRHPGAHPAAQDPKGGGADGEQSCGAPKTIDLAELVRKVGLAPSPDTAYVNWAGKCVTVRARVFNVEVNSKTRIFRILFDPPRETRGVVKRMSSDGRVLMLTCTSPSRHKFQGLSRGATAQVTGELTRLDISNAKWLTIRLKGCSISRSPSSASVSGTRRECARLRGCPARLQHHVVRVPPARATLRQSRAGSRRRWAVVVLLFVAWCNGLACASEARVELVVRSDLPVAAVTLEEARSLAGLATRLADRQHSVRQEAIKELRRLVPRAARLAMLTRLWQTAPTAPKPKLVRAGVIAFLSSSGLFRTPLPRALVEGLKGFVSQYHTTTGAEARNKVLGMLAHVGGCDIAYLPGMVARDVGYFYVRHCVGDRRLVRAISSRVACRPDAYRAANLAAYKKHCPPHVRCHPFRPLPSAGPD